MSVSDSAAASRSADSRTFFIIEDGAEVTINDFTVVVPAEVASLMDITVVSMDNAAVSAENYVVNVTGSSSESAKVTGIAIGPQTASGNINIVNSNPGTVTIDPANGSDKEIQDSIVENNPDIPSEDVSAKYDAATAEDFIKNLAEYGEVRLTADFELTAEALSEYSGYLSKIDIYIDNDDIPDAQEGSLYFPIGKYNINLNNHTLTSIPWMTASSDDKDNASNVTVSNGRLEIKLSSEYPSYLGVIGIYSNATLIFENVSYETNLTGFSLAAYEKGMTLEIREGSHIVTSGAYAVATNASTPPVASAVTVNIFDSIIESKGGMAVCFNVIGNLNIDNSTISGDWHGVMVRGGTAEITGNTTISAVCDSDYNPYDDPNKDWGSGNCVPFAALVIGNRSNSYAYPTICNVSDGVTIEMTGSGAKNHRIYIAASNGPDCSVTAELPDAYTAEVKGTGSYWVRNPENGDLITLDGEDITVNP